MPGKVAVPITTKSSHGIHAQSELIGARLFILHTLIHLLVLVFFTKMALHSRQDLTVVTCEVNL